jgi:hypothetical protein
MREYRLNPEAAKAAGVGSRITATGKYVGRITAAVHTVSSKKGSEGIEISFESDDGATADYLTLWTHNAEGDELYGYKTLNALMACMKLRELKATNGRSPDRNGGTQEAFVYTALLQRVGLVLQREDYVSTQGKDSFKFNIVLPFAADTGLTAAEILARATTPEQADKVASTLKDKAPRKAPSPSSTGYSQAPASHAGGGGMVDDDIPFNVYMPRRACYGV